MFRVVQIGGTLPADVSPLLAQLAGLMNSDQTTGLVLALDVCGGHVGSSLDTLCDSIWHWRENGPKPIHAYVEKDALSAGLMLACACSQIIMHPQARIGSLKVRAVVGADWSRNVAIAGDYELQPGEVMTPATAESRESAQHQAELELAAFVAAIGLYRGIDEAEVRRRYGTGGVFAAPEALARGAADGVMTKAELRQWLVSQGLIVGKRFSETGD